MNNKRATDRQKEYLKRVCKRFGIQITNDRLTFLDVYEASSVIAAMKKAEKVADWLEEKELGF